MKQLFMKVLLCACMILVTHALFSSQASVLAQAVNVSGTVVDTNGEPMPGVNIKIKGTTKGTVSDLDGKFNIDVPSTTSALEFSFIGYGTKEVIVGTQRNISVQMEEADKKLDEVVVIGYGTTRKVDLTGAVSSVSSEDLNQGISQSVFQALQGKAAGVTVMQDSGEPGGGVQVRIRGAGSINDNSPLYVVDGVVGSIPVNPADIESMSVLKDASSAAIYGSRGANGVIIVTTKKGTRDGKTTVSFNTTQGVQQVWRMPSALTAEERNMIHTEALTNDGIPQTDPIWDYYKDPNNAVTRTNWFDEMFRTAYISNQDLNISGGSKKSNFSFSLGYLNNNGVVEKTNFKRYSIRLNSQHEILKDLTFGENLAIEVGNQRQADQGSYDGVLSASLFNMRNTPVWQDEANHVYGSPTGDFPNPVASLNSKDMTQKNLSMGGNLYLEYKFLDMFTVKTDYSYRMYNGNYKRFVSVAKGGGRGLDQNSLWERIENNNTWIWNNTLAFDKRTDKHHFSGLAGVALESYYSYRVEPGTGKGYTSEDLPLRMYRNANSFSDVPYDYADDNALLSYFGRLSYEYANKYLISANYRADGSSKFAPGNSTRWGKFPSVSGGWRISEESFFKGLTKYVSDLKLRASWGKIGNDKIPNYLYLATTSPLNSDGKPTLGGEAVSAYASNRIPNPYIKWETTTQTDIGIDMGLLNNNLSITADYFIKKTNDILVQPPITGSLGVGDAPYINAGEVSNKGFDLGIAYHNHAHEFTYEISANLSHVKNKVETLGIEGLTEIFASNYKNTNVGRITEGEPIGHFYVLHSLGIFQTQNEIDSYVKDGTKIQPNAVPGDLKFEDRDGDGVISSNDKFNGGSSFPTFTYSLNFDATYKGFDFNMVWIGSSGNEIFNGLKVGGVLMQGTSYNNSTDILDRWTPQNTGGKIPRVSTKDLNGNRQYSTFLVENGSYARLKYLTLGYTISPRVLGPSISKLRVFLTMQNLITITKYTGYDPEVGNEGGFSNNMYGVDRGIYPQAKTFMLGLNLTF